MCLSSLIHTLTALQISLTAEKTCNTFFAFQISKPRNTTAILWPKCFITQCLGMPSQTFYSL